MMIMWLNFEACTVVYKVFWMLVFVHTVFCQIVMLVGLVLTTFLTPNCYEL